MRRMDAALVHPQAFLNETNVYGTGFRIEVVGCRERGVVNE